MSGRSFQLTLGGGSDTAPSPVTVDQLVIAGWTGRDAAAVERHIRELESLGVRRPASSPIFYRVAAARLTLDSVIEVVGGHSSGEAEVLLLQSTGRLWVGVGSDHTDREVETYGVTVAKQMCDKPFAPQFWQFDEVMPHWNSLVLRSHIEEEGGLVLYQEGSVAEFLEPLELIERFAGAASLAEGTMMFCGTLSARGGLRPAERFAFELEDPVLGRRIRHQYRTTVLPIAG